MSSPSCCRFAYRYVRDGLIVDVLAPDGQNPPPALDGSLKAVGIPGGTQALTRAETVIVQIGDHAFSLRRPTLIGAVLIKARSLLVHDDPDAQRVEDVGLDVAAEGGDLDRAHRRAVAAAFLPDHPRARAGACPAGTSW